MKDAEYRELEKRIRNYLIIHLNEHHCVFPDPVRSVLTDRSNALTYRSAAVQWNYNHLRQTVYEAVHNIFNSKDRSDIYPTAINHLYPISYCFDDVVFNLISMLDYLASLMILIIKGDIAKTIKWNSLQKTLKNDDLEFPKTAAMVREAHNSWVNRLAGYRASVYHTSNVFSTAEHWFDYKDGTDNIIFLLPEEAVKQLPCFKKGDKVDVLIGAEQLIEGCYEHLEKLLQTCYLEKPKISK